MNWPRRLAVVALWLPIVVYATLVARHFFHVADTAVYLSADDGVANIAYALGTEGRYGFLSSPILTGMSRDNGLFSYGPFYFSLGAALIWFFGYSLTLLRFIHLAIILGIAAASRSWFGGAAGGVAGALTSIGLLVAFERAQWPMVRPDSMVSLCAVSMVVCSGLAMRTGRARWWLAAGFAASCGALTHLVAWSLVPAMAVILMVALVANARGADGRWRLLRAPGAAIGATVAGGLAGAALFYGSFGFRFREQWLFLTDYQRLTGSMSAATAASPTFAELLVQHFKLAYWYLPYPLEYAVSATAVVASCVVVLLLCRPNLPARQQSLAWIAPPVIVWLAYLSSLGVYNNFHAGYAILNQVMWLWTGGALIAAGAELLVPWVLVRRLALSGAWVVATSLGVGLLTLLAQRTDYRALAASASVSITDYVDRVLQPLPAHARAWGTVELGIETPGRVQLVQFWDGIKVIEVLAPAVRGPLAPDYLVWGTVENRINVSEVLVAAGTRPTGLASQVGSRRLHEAFPAARFSLVSMTDGAPYGVTRVYARTDELPAIPRPLVSAYDAKTRQWNSALGDSVPLVPTAAGPAELGAALPDGARRIASQTVRAELAPGRYLLRVAMAPTVASDEAVIVAASSAPTIADDLTQAASGVDVSPWFTSELAVYLIHTHAGGSLYISQFGTAAPSIVGVEAARILALPNFADRRRAAVPEQALPAETWSPAFPEIRLARRPAAVTVAGNATLYGYQAYGPRIPVEPNTRMRLRIPVTVTAGRGCLGVLDGTELSWLVAPDRLSPEYEFQINNSHTVKPVLADCSTSAAGVVPLQATIGDGAYMRWSDREELYVDQLMREFRRALPR